MASRADTLAFVDKQMEWQDAKTRVEALSPVSIDTHTWQEYYVQLVRMLIYLDPSMSMDVHRPYMDALKDLAYSLPQAYQSLKWYAYQKLSELYILDDQQEQVRALLEEIVRDVLDKPQRNAQDTLNLTQAMVSQLFCYKVLPAKDGQRNLRYLRVHGTDHRLPLALATYKKNYNKIISLSDSLLRQSNLRLIEISYIAQLLHETMQHVPATRYNTQKIFNLLDKQATIYAAVQQARNYDYTKHKELQEKSRVQAELQKQSKMQQVHHTRIGILTGSIVLVLIVFVGVIYYHQSEFEASILNQVRREKNVRSTTLGEAKKAYRNQLQLVRNLNHDIRVPLNALMGFSHILSSSDKLSADEQRTAGQAIRQSSTQLLEMINNLLAIARLETHKMSLEWRTLSVRELLLPHEWKELHASIQPTHSLRVQPVASESTIYTDNRHVRKIIELIVTAIVRQTSTASLLVTSRIDQQAESVRITIQTWADNIDLSVVRDALDVHKKMSDYDDAEKYYLVLARMLAQLIGGQLLLDEQASDAFHLNLLLPLSNS